MGNLVLWRIVRSTASQEQRFRQAFVTRVFDGALPCTSKEQHRAAEGTPGFPYLESGAPV